MEKVDNCPENKIPSLSPENYEIWQLFQLMLPGLVQKYGYDYSAIKTVFDIYKIDYQKRQTMLNQIIKLIRIINQERHKGDTV